ncbi:class E sortase [Lysinimonas soli]|uniref:Class E sortase n=1 Tax=Lysinimonas soli TaxID=1074233 RepID=A0ABW0NSP1_9MICO
MTQPDQDALDAVPSPPAPRPRRRRVSVVGVLGELLITAGVLVLLFLGWQQWLNNIIVGNEVRGQAVQQSKIWDKSGAVAKPADPADPPVISVAPANAQRFAMLIVPRFGADYYRPIAEGTGVKDVLNKGELGHYPTTQMPGALGNFAIASHRHAYGGNLLDENKLQVGDHIFVETVDGWYQYSFRNLQYVKPTGVGVLDPVPEQSGVQPTERYITLTTCNPLFSTAERMIAYGTFDKFFPRAGGPPAEIAATVNGKA